MPKHAERPDVLYLIRARIDSGKSRGAPQLTKDVRALTKAAAEIERLRGEMTAELARRDARISTLYVALVRMVAIYEAAQDEGEPFRPDWLRDVLGLNGWPDA